jgi:hypothetical protein
MAVNPRQPKIDALLAAIGVGDETVITSSCKGLQLADFYLIVIQVCLKPKPVEDLEEKKDSDTDENEAVTEQVMPDEAVEAKKKAEEAATKKKKTRCRVFSKFGSSEKNEKGCKNGFKCPYFHPKLCRQALKCSEGSLWGQELWVTSFDSH